MAINTYLIAKMIDIKRWWLLGKWATKKAHTETRIMSFSLKTLKGILRKQFPEVAGPYDRYKAGVEQRRHAAAQTAEIATAFETTLGEWVSNTNAENELNGQLEIASGATKNFQGKPVHLVEVNLSYGRGFFVQQLAAIEIGDDLVVCLETPDAMTSLRQPWEKFALTQTLQAQQALLRLAEQSLVSSHRASPKPPSDVFAP